MADISKCVGTDCPLKNRCLRYTAPSSDFNQSYLLSVPFTQNSLTSTCNYFLMDFKADSINIFNKQKK